MVSVQKLVKNKKELFSEYTWQTFSDANDNVENLTHLRKR